MRALLLAIALTPPVPGAVERGFEYAGDPFAPGHHRGVDLRAAPGDAVRAACSGRVTFAGRAGANGRAVTIRCGAWSVTHLPLATIDTRAGATLIAGTPIGTAAAPKAHRGLHLGVRRTTDPDGYVDPAPLLHAPPRPAPPATPRAIRRRSGPPPAHPAPLPSAPPRLPAPLRAGPAPATPARAPAARPGAPGSSPLAPWPAWAGLALLLAGAAGAAGAGTARARRTRRGARARATPAAGTVGP